MSNLSNRSGGIPLSGGMEAKLGTGAIIPAFIVGAIGLIASSVAKGFAGFWGAALAQVVVIVFFAVHLILSKTSEKMDPTSVMVLAMLSYFVKILILGVIFFLVLANVGSKTLNRSAFGVVAIAVIIAWLTGEIRAFFALRMQMPLPNSANTSSAPASEQ